MRSLARSPFTDPMNRVTTSLTDIALSIGVVVGPQTIATVRKGLEETTTSAAWRWCDQIWTLLATGTQQRRSAFAFLANYSITAFLTERMLPTLAIDTSWGVDHRSRSRTHFRPITQPLCIQSAQQ